MRSLPFLALGFLAVAACKHDDGASVGTATIHSGSPEGPRVTDVRTVPADATSTRLTRTICDRERSCAERRGDDAAAQKSEQNCTTQVAPTAATMVASLRCDTAAARPGFEGCLAAIRAEGCDTTSGFAADFFACRIAQVCAGGQ